MTADLDFFLNRPAFARRSGSEKAWWEGWNGWEAKQIDPSASIEEWMYQSGTDWEVETKELSYTVYDHYGFPTAKESSGRALIRTDTNAELEVVGPQYCPVQNSDMFRFMREYLESDIAHIETAGSLRGGREVFVLAHIKDGEFFLPGDDKVAPYLLAVARHGSGCSLVKLVYVRVVCSNTLAVALNEKSAMELRIIHRSNWTEEKEKQAKLDLGITMEQINQRKQSIELMATTNISDGQAENYFIELLGKPAKSIDEQPKAVYNTMDLFAGKGIGSELAAANGTAWGAFNAITEWVDHHRGTEGNRQFQALLGQGALIKQQAFESAYELAKAA